MAEDFSKIDQLVSDFESSLPIDSLLAEINADEDLLWNWHEKFEVYEFVFIVPESAVFITDDSIREYYEPEYLLQLGDDEVVGFVTSQIEGCIESGDTPAVHFCEISRSIVSVIGEQRGQAGIGFVEMDITKTRSEKFQRLYEIGYLFLPNEHFVIDEEFLVEKYQKFIRDRLSAKK